MNFIEIMQEGIVDVVNAEWTEVTSINFVPQLQRFNYANEIERAGLIPPYAVINFGPLASESEHSGVDAVFKTTVNIFYIDKFSPLTTVTESNLMIIKLAALAQRVTDAYFGEGVTYLEGTIGIDASDSNPAAMLFLKQDFPLTGGQVSFDVLCGFRIGAEE